MRRIAAIVLMVLPVLGAADETWQPLNGAGIVSALNDKKLRYKSASQHFYASGKTLYHQGGRESWGNWRVQKDQYCSQWPPNALWECYVLQARSGEIRFIGKSGDTTDGRFVD